MKTSFTTMLALAAACAAGACGGRSTYWDESVPGEPKSFGLADGVVIIDDADHRAVVLSVDSALHLTRTTVPIGHHFTSAVVSPDMTKLFVMSSGDWPPQNAGDQPPTLTMISVDSPTHASSTQFKMTEPLSTLAVDPLGEYVVAYYGTSTTSGVPTPFAENPNELVIFDVGPGASGLATNPVPFTLRSYGGTPQRLTFTKPMNLPVDAPTGAPRRLLVVETTLDVAILDLSHVFDPMPRKEVTVRLTNGTSQQQLSPAGLAVDPADGFIALRTTSDTNVYLLQLVASKPGSGDNDFNPTIDLVDVGGLPSDLQFVQTDSGLQLATLVPGKSSGVLIELDNNVTTPVAFAAPYSQLSLVTQALGTASGTVPTADTALLWASGQGGSGVALWTLGVSIKTPYRSVEVLSVQNAIRAVDDVPVPNDFLKVLETTPSASGSFFVLNLVQRTAAPVVTTSDPSIAIAPGGLRVWAFAQGGTELASIPLDTLNPTPLTTSLPIQAVYDVGVGGTAAAPSGAATTGPEPPHALVALHGGGTFGATVFDAHNPDATKAQRYSALLLEGP